MHKQVYLAVLSVDNEALDGYKSALETLFENQVISTHAFQWGVPNVHTRGVNFRRRHDEDDGEAFRMAVPAVKEVELSLFIERFINSFNTAFDELPRRLADETFTLALFEAGLSEQNNVVVDRVRVLTKIQFVETGVGRGHKESDQEKQMRLEREASPRYRPMPIYRDEVTGFSIAGENRLVSDDLRNQVIAKAQGLVGVLKLAKLNDMAKPNSEAGKVVRKAANDSLNKPTKKDLSKK